MIVFSDVKQWWIGQYEVIKAQLNGTTVWEKETNPDPFYLTNDDRTTIMVSITKTSAGNPTLSLEISDDGSTWTSLGSTSTTALSFTIPVGGRKYIRSITDSAWSSNYFSCTGVFGAHGDIMTLLGYNTLKGRDCENMFSGCTGLTTAPKLPATTLAMACYSYMFWGCTSLTTAPELPATTLTNYCYYAMFMGCTGLTAAPELPATILTTECYRNMFNGCSSLSSITCNATDISATDCTTNWVMNVAASGIFYKNQAMSSWTTGFDGIPSGWTVQDIQ